MGSEALFLKSADPAMKTDKVSAVPSEIPTTGEADTLNPPAFRRWSKLQWLETVEGRWCLTLHGNRSLRIKENQLGQFEVSFHSAGIAQLRSVDGSLRAAIESADRLWCPSRSTGRYQRTLRGIATHPENRSVHTFSGLTGNACGTRDTRTAEHFTASL
jgi:hypothetical protein